MLHCGPKGMEMVSNNTWVGCVGLIYLVLNQSVPEKYPPHHYRNSSSSLNCLYNQGLMHGLMLFTSNSDPTSQMLLQKWR